MNASRGDPRVLIIANQGSFRDEVMTYLAGLAPVCAAPDTPAVLELIEGSPTLRVAIVVEQSDTPVALELLQAIKASGTALAVFLLSHTPTIEHATEAIRRGAEDFVPIPYSKDLLRKEIDRALEAAELRDGITHLRSLVSTSYGFERIVTASAEMRPVLERALAAARSETPVLITGETGTGKELLARAIHANSRRRDRPFVPVNCAALPHDLIESELFGHRRGAFSGAHADHAGLFASAHRGTLMLDEIGDLPAEAQAKLLRVLQDGEVRPVGGLESRKVDVRMIAATNRRLQNLRGGAIRPDLFYRLSVLVIQVPALRKRSDDIPRLVQHFLAECRQATGTRLCRVTPEAQDALAGYPYPGNVRELENLVHNLCATLPPDRMDIRREDVHGWFRRQGIRPSPAPGDEPSALPVNLRELEAWAIRRALEEAAGNKSRAAALLGISRDSLYRKLQEMDLALSDSRTVGAKPQKGRG